MKSFKTLQYHSLLRIRRSIGFMHAHLNEAFQMPFKKTSQHASLYTR